MLTYFPKISVLLPHLSLGSQDREMGLERCKKSIKNQEYPSDLIEVFVLDGEGTVPEKINSGSNKVKGEYIVFAANDTEFNPDAFEKAVEDSLYYDKALVAFNDGPVYPDEGNICTHFMIRKDFIPQIGEIFCPRMRHVGVDNLLWAKCSRLNQAMRSEKAKFVHHHFSKGAKFDDVYQRGWKNAEKDREILKDELSLLEKM